MDTVKFEEGSRFRDCICQGFFFFLIIIAINCCCVELFLFYFFVLFISVTFLLITGAGGAGGASWQVMSSPLADLSHPERSQRAERHSRIFLFTVCARVRDMDECCGKIWVEGLTSTDGCIIFFKKNKQTFVLTETNCHCTVKSLVDDAVLMIGASAAAAESPLKSLPLLRPPTLGCTDVNGSQRDGLGDFLCRPQQRENSFERRFMTFVDSRLFYFRASPDCPRV